MVDGAGDGEPCEQHLSATVHAEAAALAVVRPAVLVVQSCPRPARDLLHLLDEPTRAGLPARSADTAASAHALLRLVLSDLTARAPHEHRIDHLCATCGGDDHGRPVLHGAALHVSLSRTRTAVAVAVSADAPVGIDVEQVAAAGFDGFDDVALAAGERAGDAQARARAWSRKEAVLKARGTGLSVDPRTVDVRRDRTGDAYVLDVPTSPALASAVAVVTARRPDLRVQERELSR